MALGRGLGTNIEAEEQACGSSGNFLTLPITARTLRVIHDPLVDLRAQALGGSSSLPLSANHAHRFANVSQQHCAPTCCSQGIPRTAR